MIGLLALAQMMNVPSTDREPAVPTTAFSCTFMRSAEAGATSAFEINGVIPAMPEGHDPNGSFPMVLASKDGSPLAGNASANMTSVSDWYREYQIYRSIGDQRYTLNLQLRREGLSVAYTTLYDPVWKNEPYRYDAVGLCVADFSPKSDKPS